MPFDVTVFCDLPDADTGIFREWSLDRFRFWLKSSEQGGAVKSAVF